MGTLATAARLLRAPVLIGAGAYAVHWLRYEFAPGTCTNLRASAVAAPGRARTRS